MDSVTQAVGSQDSAHLVPPPAVDQPKTPTEEPKFFFESSSSGPVASLQTPQAERLDRGKQTPPPPPTSSMTPPPSTQIPMTEPSITRTPVQATSVLSSPPPTNRADEISGASDTSTLPVNEGQILAADLNELRSMALEMAKDNKEMRASVAHYKLQLNMAFIENQEAANRMAVELDMAQREVEVLQENEARRQETAAMTPMPNWQNVNSSPYDASYVNDLLLRVQTLEADKNQLQNMVRNLKRIITHQDGEISSLSEQTDQLRSRIRENREHINRMRRSNGLGIFEGTPRSEGLATPYQQTPVRRSAQTPSSNRHVGGSNFDTLLLADKMLTEASRSHTSKSRSGHTRNAHSVPSVPSTPSRSRPVNAATAANFRTPQAPPKAAATISAPHTAPVARYKPIERHNRNKRANSESTISESDDDRTNEDISDNDEIPESQASRSATDLLRRSMTSSQQSAGGKPNSFQTKLYGQVKKPMMEKQGGGEKRKISGDEVAIPISPSKKGRTGSIGLGIH
ncbi:hypothetical protein EV356DRAFT_500327 [Viridothelium virens]|uniref:Uncharacterized protein n=1 Tax=Viridothelium virens TaxID=1048519 RepID=A0A6A6HC75_VIRVR|nr:hypothetical protein EV356DRAFT_500327 [Viridothelium virens]